MRAQRARYFGVPGWIAGGAEGRSAERSGFEPAVDLCLTTVFKDCCLKRTPRSRGARLRGVTALPRPGPVSAPASQRAFAQGARACGHPETGAEYGRRGRRHFIIERCRRREGAPLAALYSLGNEKCGPIVGIRRSSVRFDSIRRGTWERKRLAAVPATPIRVSNGAIRKPTM